VRDRNAAGDVRHEVELVADDLVTIGRGRIVAQGAKVTLLSGTGACVTSLGPARLRTTLLDAGLHVPSVGGRDGRAGGPLTVDADGEQVGRVSLAASKPPASVRSPTSALGWVAAARPTRSRTPFSPPVTK